LLLVKISGRTKSGLYALALFSAFLVAIVVASYVSGKESWNAGFAGTAVLPGVGESDFSGLCIFVDAHRLGPFTLSTSTTGDCVLSQDIHLSSGSTMECEVHASVMGWKTAEGFTNFTDFFVTSAMVSVNPPSATQLCLALFLPATNQSTGVFTGSFDTGIQAVPGHRSLNGVNGFTELQTNVVLYS
jgi:hypothetical protein